MLLVYSGNYLQINICISHPRMRENQINICMKVVFKDNSFFSLLLWKYTDSLSFINLIYTFVDLDVSSNVPT